MKKTTAIGISSSQVLSEPGNIRIGRGTVLTGIKPCLSGDSGTIGILGIGVNYKKEFFHQPHFKRVIGGTNTFIGVEPEGIFVSTAPDIVWGTETFESLSNYNSLDIENILGKANSVIENITNVKIKEQSKLILKYISYNLAKYCLTNYELSDFPKLNAVQTDNSILLEWILDNYRIGFNVENDPKESSWYLVTNESMGNMDCIGYINYSELPKVVDWLLYFVFQYI